MLAEANCRHMHGMEIFEVVQNLHDPGCSLRDTSTMHA